MYSLLMVAALSTGMSAQDCFKLRCWGRCSGSSCYAACSCWGCSGCSRACSGCFGSRCFSRCSGTCYSACYGCQGVYAGGCYSSAASYQGHGCYGCTVACHGAMPVQSRYQPESSEPEKQPTQGKQTSYYQPTSESARLIIHLPADARLYVDGVATRTMGQEVRTYRTPELEYGQEYVYTLKMEIDRDGKTLTETKRIFVRAGQASEARFDEPTPAVAAN